MSLSKKTALDRTPAVLLLFPFLILLTATYSHHTLHRILTHSAMERRQAIAELAAATLREKFDHMTDLGLSLATRQRFRHLINEDRWQEAIDIVKKIPNDFPFVDRLFLADPSGTLKADIPETPAVHGKNFAYRDWYQGVSRSWKPYVSEVYQRAAPPQTNVVAVATPIKSEEGEVLGILVFQLRLDTFFEWSRRIDVGSEGLVYFVDPKGRIAGHPRFLGEGKAVDFSSILPVQRVLRGETGVVVHWNPIEEEEKVAAYAPVSEYGWGVVVTQPTSAAWLQRNRTLRFTLLIEGLFCLLGFLLAFLGMKALALRRKAEKVIEETARVKSEFVSTVSHELRTPLMAVQGWIDLVWDGSAGPLNPEQKEYLTTAKRNIDRLGRLVTSVLDYQKLEAGRIEFVMKPQDLNELVRETTEGFSPLIGQKGLELRLDLMEGLPPVSCDRDKIIQVLTNLLNNAVKFTERGSIRVQTEKGENWVRVSVKDQGPGILPEDQPKLFQSFSQLAIEGARKVGGTGLGLAISRKILEAHGGKIGAESVPGEGSTFYFILPIRNRRGN